VNHSSPWKKKTGKKTTKFEERKHTLKSDLTSEKVTAKTSEHCGPEKREEW